MIKASGPNDTGSNTDEHIEADPHFGKKPVRGSKGRFVQGEVPIVYRTLGGKASKNTGGHTNTNGVENISRYFFQTVKLVSPKITIYSLGYAFGV